MRHAGLTYLGTMTLSPLCWVCICWVVYAYLVAYPTHNTLYKNNYRIVQYLLSTGAQEHIIERPRQYTAHVCRHGAASQVAGFAWLREKRSVQ